MAYLCTNYKKNDHTDDKSPLKVPWSGSHDPFFILRPQRDGKMSIRFWAK